MRLLSGARSAPFSFWMLVISAAVAAEAQEFNVVRSEGHAGYAFARQTPVSRAPALEALIPVPRLVDPGELDLINLHCRFTALLHGPDWTRPVANARFVYDAELLVHDSGAGSLESYRIRSGRSKTTTDGVREVEIAVPTALFAEGFESGDVTAWTRVRAAYQGGKKAITVALGCGFDLDDLIGASSAVERSIGLQAAADTSSDLHFTGGHADAWISERRAASRMPEHEVWVPVPSTFAVSGQDFALINCLVGVRSESASVGGVGFTHETRLHLLDNRTGALGIVRVGKGQARTRGDGVAEFAVVVPGELFADGFESGDVTAWAVIRSRAKGSRAIYNSGSLCRYTLEVGGR